MTIIDDIVTSMWEPAVYRSTGSLGWFELESEIRFHFQYISKWIHHDLLTWDTMHECLGCYLGHECCYRRDIVIRGTQKSWYCCVDCKTLTFFMYDNKTRRPTSEVMSSSTEDSYFHVISCDENTDYQELLKDRMRECLRFCEKNFDSCKRARTQVFSGVVYVDSDDVPTNVSPFTVVDPKSQTWVNIKVYQEPTCVFEDPICCERYGNSLRCLLHGCYTYEFVKDLYKVGEERLKSHYVVEKGKESESNSTTTGCEKTFEKEKEAAGKCRKHLTTSVMSNESDRSSRGTEDVKASGTVVILCTTRCPSHLIIISSLHLTIDLNSPVNDHFMGFIEIVGNLYDFPFGIGKQMFFKNLAIRSAGTQVSQ